MIKRLLILALTAAFVSFNAPLYAETKDEIGIKRAADSAVAKITNINGNIITITDDRGNSKTLELVSTRGLAIGAKTGWCEEDCGRLKIGDQTIRVQRVVEGKR